MMKKILFILAVVFLSTACSKIDYTHYIISVYNESSTDILVEYQTVEKEESIVLKPNDNFNSHKEIYRKIYEGNKDLIPYTETEFKDRILSIKLSIVNGNDIIPLSKEFAPFENWGHKEIYDDQIIHHYYGLSITDEMLD